ncbi:TfpX/TfpZ family type IV pilin accessory protein [Acidovorax sp. Root568]|uniref:TfpX/TfpZ family type IV pilin accessory protein n=1 Tax=Acidovorax sp. Root568 TaxID=1736565 RepID=UPI0006F5172D|nr:TfpX/TfpZ family type IV pilin accessory protein [Acidovorax sp. Root568]KRA18729.1 pilus assembly protein [Acidovorax sp. Root568]
MHHWKGRLRAGGIHLGISLSVALLAALLVLGLWYPYPYREISGGRTLFVLMVGVDVVMGPLLTLVIFNRAKPRKELVMDFTVVALLQLVALGYGLWTVFAARPVHMVFEYTRMTVVHAVDVDASLLDQAPVALRSLPLRGPTPIALRPFKDASEQFDATMSAIGGVPLAARSDLWQAYEDSRANILREARPASELLVRFASQAASINMALQDAGRPIHQLRYLPLVSRDKVWTVLLDATTAQPLAFMPIDSF